MHFLFYISILGAKIAKIFNNYAVLNKKVQILFNTAQKTTKTLFFLGLLIRHVHSYQDAGSTCPISKMAYIGKHSWRLGR